MPIWLRKFTFQTIQEHMDKLAEQSAQARGQASTKAPVKGPNVKPDFTTKRSSK